jgi:hypothetical protein
MCASRSSKYTRPIFKSVENELETGELSLLKD